jgi:hypothetical protein
MSWDPLPMIAELRPWLTLAAYIAYLVLVFRVATYIARRTIPADIRTFVAWIVWLGLPILAAVFHTSMSEAFFWVMVVPLPAVGLAIMTAPES